MNYKKFLITGAGGGIGSAIVRKIAQNIESGVILLHFNNNIESVQKLKKEIETDLVKVDLIQANLERKEECQKLCDTIISKYGAVDVLVNNAGFVEDKEISERTYEDFEKTVKINLIANFYLSKVLGLKMFEQKFGKIINISSTNGLILHSGSMCPTSIDYDATKAGINALTKNFAIEFAPYVNVNAVAPGMVDTPMNAGILDFSEMENTLFKRMAKPEEIADLVWFLISDKADFINGSIYEIDGGKK